MSDIGDLFDRDPLGLSEQDLARIITRMREHQAQYDLGVKTPVAARPKRTSKTQDLLKDLGLA